MPVPLANTQISLRKQADTQFHTVVVVLIFIVYATANYFTLAGNSLH